MGTYSKNTKNILNIFEQISSIPRKSKHEEKIINWLISWGKKHSFQTKKDGVGNIVITVPASSGYENKTGVVIQGHMDMVCEKTPDSNHDFSKDPIKLIYDGDWLRAEKTSLGSDNGIAIALALAIAKNKDLKHPELELLFTVDEETGLTGANKLESNFIKGKYLLNIDSEDEGVLTIGCAGGLNSTISLPLEYTDTPSDYKPYKLKVGGLTGGHSGIDINKERGNAIKILVRVFDYLQSKNNIKLKDISGGTAHNAIPREAYATIIIQDFSKMATSLQEIETTLKNEFSAVNPGLFLRLEPLDINCDQILTERCTKTITSFISAIPHGVYSMSTKIHGLVETSNNIATITTENNILKILSSQRSSRLSRARELTRSIACLTQLAGGTITNSDGYSPWEPNWNSRLLEICKKVYKDNFKKEPVIEIIHAGLECGIIGNKYKGMEMISMGPTIKNPHSPDECMKISDVDKIWTFIVKLLEALT